MTTDVTDNSVLAVVKEEQEHAICVSGVTRQQQMSGTPVLRNASVIEILQVDLYLYFGQQSLFMAARGMMNVFSRWHFCIQIVNTPSSIIKPGKHERVSIARLSPLQIIRSRDDEPSLHPVSHLVPNFVNFVNYKPTPDCLHQIHHYQMVQKNDDNRHKRCW